MLERIRSTVSYISRGCAWLLRVALSCCLAVLLAAVVIQVIGRFVFQSTPAWTEPLSGVLLTWLSFLGAAYALRSGESLAIDLLPKALRGALHTTVAFVVALAGGVFAWLLLTAGVQQIELTGPSTLLGLDVSAAWLYASAPVSAVFMFIFLVDGALTQPPSRPGATL